MQAGKPQLLQAEAMEGIAAALLGALLEALLGLLLEVLLEALLGAPLRLAAAFREAPAVTVADPPKVKLGLGAASGEVQVWAAVLALEAVRASVEVPVQELEWTASSVAFLGPSMAASKAVQTLVQVPADTATLAWEVERAQEAE